LQILNLQVGR